MTWHGVRTVALHEFRLRLRAGRWRWLLAAWFGVLLSFTALLRAALASGNSPKLGTPMFGGLMLFLLGLGLLVVPALTAQSVNGDRERGVLASLQVTLLSSAEIAIGKLLAGWATATVFVAMAIPMVIWSMIEGGVGFVQAIVTLLVVVILLGIVCAIAQCFSAIFVRGTTSAVMTYLAVFTLSAGTLIMFGLAGAATATTVERESQYLVCPDGGFVESFEDETCVNADGSTSPAKWQTEKYLSTQPRFDLVWWLLAPNPFVILADASPTAPPYWDSTGHIVKNELDPLAGVANQVESLRHQSMPQVQYTDSRPNSVVPIWVVGLLFDALLGGLAIATTIRRLKAPAEHLGRGVRIA